MWNPFKRRSETRADATRLAVESIEARALGGAVSPERLAVCRAVATLYGRAFEGVEVEVEGLEVATDWLPIAVREIVLRGESVGEVEVEADNRRLRILTAAAFDVRGGADPEGWRYRLDLSGPNGSEVKSVPRDGVLHLTWDADSIEPWRGRGPWYNSDTLRALAALEGSARYEGEQAHGRYASIPRAVPEAVRSAIRAALKRLRGGAVLLDELRDQTAAQVSSTTGLQLHRTGFDAPESLPILRRELEESVGAAAGVPSSLLFSTSGGSTSGREDFRRFYHVAVKPLAARIAAELSRAAGRPVRLNLRRLGAADVTSKARAAADLAAAGLGLDGPRILEIVGLD